MKSNHEPSKNLPHRIPRKPTNPHQTPTAVPSSSPDGNTYTDDVRPRMQQAPSSPVRIQSPAVSPLPASSATVEHGGIKMRNVSLDDELEPPAPVPPIHTKRKSSIRPVPPGDRGGTHLRQDSDTLAGDYKQPSRPYAGTHVRNISAPMLDSMDPLDLAMNQFNIQTDASRSGTPTIQLDDVDGEANDYQGPSALTYHHEKAEEERKRQKAAKKASKDFVGTLHNMQTLGAKNDALPPSRGHSQTPSDSSITRLGAELPPRGRSLPPNGNNKNNVSSSGDNSRPISSYAQISDSPARRSPIDRPVSTVDLLNIPYSQQMAHQMLAQDNARLQIAVGTNAALLDTKKTLDMYRANVKKTTDGAVQYDFAVFMVNAVQEAAASSSATHDPSPNTNNTSTSRSPHRSTETDSLTSPETQKTLLKEARTILHRLADKGNAYAQYYLADGYASGLFNSGKPDHSAAFPQFLAAGKHGHAEAAYRTALSYEFGWGSRRDPAKAVQFHRQAASKGHPGAALRLGKACLTGDMGLSGKAHYREGITWLKRASESADRTHNSAPYELGLLHASGYGADVFKDEAYAAQLLTRSAELGHELASLRLGEVYEHGLLTCPRDPALSIHFYNGAAQAGVREAMMALCAWYMVGAAPVLEKDEAEAYEWARRAALAGNDGGGGGGGGGGYPKAEYTMGYFTEMGVGCRRDPLEANVWYVRAAEGGDERAVHRLAIIRAAEMGDVKGVGGEGGEAGKKGKGGLLRKKKSAHWFNKKQ